MIYLSNPSLGVEKAWLWRWRTFFWNFVKMNNIKWHLQFFPLIPNPPLLFNMKLAIFLILTVLYFRLEMSSLLGLFQSLRNERTVLKNQQRLIKVLWHTNKRTLPAIVLKKKKIQVRWFSNNIKIIKDKRNWLEKKLE